MRRTKRRINKRPKKKVSRRRPIKKMMMRGGENCEDFLQKLPKDFDTLKNIKLFYDKLETLHTPLAQAHELILQKQKELEEILTTNKTDPKQTVNNYIYYLKELDDFQIIDCNNKIHDIIKLVEAECSIQQGEALERQKKRKGFHFWFKKQDLKKQSYSDRIPLYLPNFDDHDEQYEQLNEYIKGKGITLGNDYPEGDKNYTHKFLNKINGNFTITIFRPWRHADFIEGWTVDSQSTDLSSRDAYYNEMTYKFNNVPMFQIKCKRTVHNKYIIIYFKILKRDMPSESIA